MKKYTIASLVSLVCAFFVYIFIIKNIETDAQQISPATKAILDLEKSGAKLFKLKNLAGEEVSLDSFKDKVILLNFWASWCEPCIREFPSMIKLIEHFKGQVVMIAVSNDKNKEDITDFLKVFKSESKSPFLYLLWDPERVVSKQYGSVALPETFIFTKNLQFIRKVTGIDKWYNDDTIEFIKSIL